MARASLWRRPVQGCRLQGESDHSGSFGAHVSFAGQSREGLRVRRHRDAQDRAGGEGSVQAQVVADQVRRGRLPHSGFARSRPQGEARPGRGSKSHSTSSAASSPAAVCYSQIVPVDEVVTLTPLSSRGRAPRPADARRARAQRLDRLWDELEFVSQEALTVEVGFEQFMEYATQDGDPKLFEPLRKPIAERPARFRKRLIDTEPKHLDAVLDFRRTRLPPPAGRSRKRRAAEPLRAGSRKQELDTTTPCG